MLRQFVFFGFVVVLTGSACQFLSSAYASDPGISAEKSAILVSQAIQEELNGDLLARDRLLSEAQLIDSNFASPRWYRGFIASEDGVWQDVDQAIEKLGSDQNLANYESYRAKLPDTVAGHWQAAAWCAENKLLNQCRAHLMNILLKDSEHVPARTALGHQLVGNNWLTVEDQLRLQQRAEFAKFGFEQYQSVIDAAFAQTQHPLAKNRTAAVEKLNSIDDVRATPVMEYAAEKYGRDAGLIAVKWLSKHEDQIATHALTRMAMYSPHAEVRQDSIAHLKSRSLYDFVPELLASMASPIEFASVPVFNELGPAGFRQVFVNESMNENRTQIFQTSLSRQMKTLGLIDREVFFPAAPGRPTGQIMTPDALLLNVALARVNSAELYAEAKHNEIRAKEENLRQKRINDQVAKLISDVTGSQFETVPRDVWRWWDKYNETNYQNHKYARQKYNQNRYSVPFLNEEVFLHSCFVAGTKVTTSHGLRSIEKILPGDLVLSRSVATGELCFKPVVAATSREPAKTVLLKVNDEIIHATTNHLLWVIGKGWTKAGVIQSGDLLHSTSDPAVVMSTTPGEPLPTHNLVVVDNHTYFVGESRVLSHDVTPRGSVHEKVPGQFLVEAK